MVCVVGVVREPRSDVGEEGWSKVKTSLERHLEIRAPEFKKLAPFLTLREIVIFGHFSDDAIELVRQKTATLGDRGLVTLHEQFAGVRPLQHAAQPVELQ